MENQIDVEKEYLESEVRYLPEQWDETTKMAVEMLMREAFRRGWDYGYNEGKYAGKRQAVELLVETIEVLQK